jgi:hypothetical protein
MTLFLLSISCMGSELFDAALPYGNCHSIFINDFKVYRDSDFADDLWIRSDKAFLTILFVRHNSNFAIESMRRPWLFFCYRFHAGAVNYLTLLIPYVRYDSEFSDNFKVYSDSVFVDDLWITSDIAFLTIPCVNNDYVFSIDFMRQLWICFRCLFHASSLTQQ